MKTIKSLWPFVLLSPIVGAGIYFIGNYQRARVNPSLVLSVTPPTPSPTPKAKDQVSPDGTQTVMLTTMGEQIKIFVNDQQISTKRIGPGEEFLVPFNTWSPNNKYFFLNLKKIIGDEYLVMKATGEESLIVSELFVQAYPENTIVSVTGWASPTLLILNAKSEKEADMSFWFDVQTHKFFRLSTYFY